MSLYEFNQVSGVTISEYGVTAKGARYVAFAVDHEHVSPFNKLVRAFSNTGTRRVRMYEGALLELMDSSRYAELHENQKDLLLQARQIMSAIDGSPSL